MSKVFPVLILLGASYFLFEDKVNNFNLDFLKQQRSAPVVSIEREVSDVMKNRVSGLIKIIQDAKLDNNLKKVMSGLWAGNGDVWKVSEINFTSDKLEPFNKDLLKSFSVLYPEIIGSVPGFSKEVENIFKEVIGEYPTPLTKEKCNQVSEISYAISWAFTQ
jgi:hypothetical protein